MKKVLLITIIIGGVILMGKRTAEARGIRNNNPGNIRSTSDKWRGLAANQTDSTFFVFNTPEYGIRALAKILYKYYTVYDLLTIREIINRYAPSVENATDKYVDFVAERLGIHPDDLFYMDKTSMMELIVAIIKMENGYCPYSEEQIMAGISMTEILLFS